MARMMMWAGALLFVTGLLFHFGGRFFPLGRLPGDIAFGKGNFTFYFPIATSLLLSLILTAILWLMRRV
jgi:hypothetical protein